MSKIITTIIVGLAGFMIVRIIAGYFDLEPKSLKLGSLLSKLPPGILQSAAVIISATAAILIMILWLVFRVDDRIRDLFDDRPALASMPIEDKPTMWLEILDAQTIRKADLVVTLRNTNAKLVRYEAVLRATINEKDLEKPAIFSGYVGPNATTSLVVSMRDVPLKKLGSANFLAEASMRYDVRYRFEDGKNERQTSKLVKWESTAPLTGTNGNQTTIEVVTRYFDQIEE